MIGTAAVTAGAIVKPVAGRAGTDALLEAARKEGEVNWYTSLVVNTAVRPMAAAFRKKYPGIEVNTVTGKVGDLLVRVNEELQAGKLAADVYHGATTLQNLRKQNEVARFLPKSAGGYPAELVDPDGYWIAQEVNFEGPACNTDMVSEAEMPKAYEDLLDPKWKGQIAWAAAMQQGGPPGFIATVLADMGDDEGLAYLKRLAAQKIVNVPTNQRALLDSVASGEYPLALCIYSHHVGIIQRDKAPVRFISLKPRVSSTLDPLYLMAKAPHPNAGKLFIDFISSPEGQKVLLGGGYNPALPEYRDRDKSYPAYSVTPNAVSAHLEKWISIYDQLFT